MNPRGCGNNPDSRLLFSLLQNKGSGISFLFKVVSQGDNRYLLSVYLIPTFPFSHVSKEDVTILMVIQADRLNCITRFLTGK